MTIDGVHLGDLLTDGRVSYGIVQPGSARNTGVPVVRAGDLRGGRIDVLNPLRVTPEASARHARTVLRGGELLFSVVGTVGETAIVPPELAGWNVARAVAVLKPHGVSTRWLEYALQAPSVKHQIDSYLNTTVQPTLNLADLTRLVLPDTPLPEQQAIAEVLGALDDKIAANTALAATADDLIRAEFLAWGTRRVRVSEVADSPRSGVDPAVLSPHDLYVGLEHIGRRNMWLVDGGEAAEVTSTKSRFETGDVLFGKLRPSFHKVVSAPAGGICSTDIMVIRAKETRLASILLAALTSDAVIEEVVSTSEGTRMPRTSWKDLAAVEVLWPNDDEIGHIATRLDAIRAASMAAIAENRTLAATRDALLPQLMSGKLRVRDAGDIARAAGA